LKFANNYNLSQKGRKSALRARACKASAPVECLTTLAVCLAGIESELLLKQARPKQINIKDGTGLFIKVRGPNAYEATLSWMIAHFNQQSCIFGLLYCNKYEIGTIGFVHNIFIYQLLNSSLLGRKVVCLVML